MESSSSSADQREEPHPLLLSPCHFFEQLITACLKCLGLDHDFSSSADAAGKTKDDHHQQYPPPETDHEVEMKFSEEVVVRATGTTARSTRALRVKRPPIGTGSGPQINKASS